MLKIEQFAEEHYGIKLTKYQLEIITLIAGGKMLIELPAKKAGIGTAYKAALGYLQDGLTEAMSIKNDFPKASPAPTKDTLELREKLIDLATGGDDNRGYFEQDIDDILGMITQAVIKGQIDGVGGLKPKLETLVKANYQFGTGDSPGYNTAINDVLNLVINETLKALQSKLGEK